MEIIGIRIYSKDGSYLPLYPCDEGCIGFDIEIYKRFLSWAVENADTSGIVRLSQNSYDTIIELTHMDDLPCPSSIVIEYIHQQRNYALGFSYSRTDFVADIVEYDEP
jgi:hypothetical protein